MLDFSAIGPSESGKIRYEKKETKERKVAKKKERERERETDRPDNRCLDAEST